MGMVESFELMLAAGRDNALLRFGLGNEYLKAGKPAAAAIHLRAALVHDPAYTAAWKLLGKALAEDQQFEAAQAAFTDGIREAEAHGDKQAAKEMAVFLRRLVSKAG